MLPNCLKCKKDTNSVNAKVSKTSIRRIILLSKYACVITRNQDLLAGDKVMPKIFKTTQIYI